MDIGEVLSRAWQIVWKHKVLWIFGILAGCVNGGMSTGNSGTSYQTEATPQVQHFMNQTPDWQIALFIGILLLIAVVIILLVIFIGTVGRIGLIRGTLQADQGAEKLNFGELFSGSTPYFWRLFGFNLLVGITVFILVTILILFSVVGAFLTLGIGILCILPLICLLIPVAWIVGVWVEQTNVAMVVEDLGIVDGMRRGWYVVKGNAGMMIVMWLILMIINIVAGFVIGLPLLLLVGPALLGAIFGGDQGLLGGVALAVMCCIAYLPILLVLSGILRSYVGSAWTLTFLRLTNKPPAIPEPEPLPELEPAA